MGIHDRDYYRDESLGWTWGRWGVTVWLIVITAIVFVLQMVARDSTNSRDLADPITDFGVCDTTRILQGQVWRLLTPVFLHAGLFHLACNMLVLYWAGSRLEERYGSREFLLFYLTAGIFSNAVFVVSQIVAITPPGFALGASGAVTAVFVLFACHYPREQILVMFVLPMPIWLLVIFYIGFDLLGVLSGGRGVGYAAHLAGALFGFIYFRAKWRIGSMIPSFTAGTRERATPRLRVLPSEPHELDDTTDEREPVAAAVEAARPTTAPDQLLEARVDQVLEKVSKHGQESLTPEERELLFRASEIYKKKRK